MEEEVVAVQAFAVLVDIAVDNIDLGVLKYLTLFLVHSITHVSDTEKVSHLNRNVICSHVTSSFATIAH